MKFRRLILLVIIGSISLGMVSACTSMRNMVVENTLKDVEGGQDSKKIEAFENRFTKVLGDIEQKDDYKKIPLDGSDDTSWFIKQSFSLWDKQQTKEQYISAGVKKFPGYTETFEYLADEFAN